MTYDFLDIVLFLQNQKEKEFEGILTALSLLSDDRFDVPMRKLIFINVLASWGLFSREFKAKHGYPKEEFEFKYEEIVYSRDDLNIAFKIGLN